MFSFALLLVLSVGLAGCIPTEGDYSGIGVSLGEGPPDSNEPDTTPPYISSKYPADGAAYVSVSGAPSVTFSKVVDPATVNSQTFTLTRPAWGGGLPVEGSVTLRNNEWTSTPVACFIPAGNLAPGTNYTARITTGVKDTSGNRLAEEKVWSFTTDFSDAFYSDPVPPEEFILLSPGTFTMYFQFSSPENITLTKWFYMGKREITVAQWEAVTGYFPGYVYSYVGYVGDTQLPAANVSWNEVQDFIAALNGMTGRTYRLPTEAEWEFAASGGRNPTGYEYAGSDNPDEVAWYEGNSGGRAHPVGRKHPTYQQFYDMSGNVHEWVNDWYSYSFDNFSGHTDPTGPSTGAVRVLRGGAFNSPIYGITVRSRGYGDPAKGYPNRGFRLVLEQ